MYCTEYCIILKCHYAICLTANTCTLHKELFNVKLKYNKYSTQSACIICQDQTILYIMFLNL